MLLPRNRRSIAPRTRKFCNKRLTSVVDHQALRKESRVLSESIIVLTEAFARASGDSDNLHAPIVSKPFIPSIVRE
jgi:hypothetical protein